MAGRQIKQEIVLSGEKQYNAAIKEAQRNLKTLQSALKAETAEMGRNASEQQKNEARVKSLKEQIKEQERIVQTLREALAAAREEYGDNGAEVARWEQRLNNARTTLANMKNDLEGVGSGFQTVSTDAAAATVAAKSVGDALGSISSAGESVSDAIESIFGRMIDTVTDAVSELWSLISETAAKANNWTDIAGYWGTDAQTIQMYARATAANGKNFEDLQSIVSKIVMGGKGKTITELLGISDVKYESDWKYAIAVMNRLYEMQKKGQDMTPIYEQIFGERRSVKVMDLVNGWGSIQDDLPQFNGNKSGYGMSDQELATMDELWVKINTIEQKWQALKENFAAGFGQVSLDLLVNVEGTLDGIADYMNAKDEAGRQAALEKIRKNVEEFFTKLGEIIQECIGILREVGGELQGSDDPLTRTIGDILVALADSLQWLVDNADAVKTAFNTIFGVWLLARLAAVAGRLGSILLQIEAVKTFKGITAATGAAEAAAAGSAVGGSWATAFWAAAIKAVPALAFFYAVANPGGSAGDDLDTMVDESTGVLTTAGREEAERRAEEAENGGPGILVVGDAERPRVDAAMFARDVAEATKAGSLAANVSPEQESAIQEWWDAWRGANNGTGSWETAEAAYGTLQDALGDRFDAIWDRIFQKLGEHENRYEMEDLPYDWYMSTTASSGAETRNENGITSSDLQRFNGLPAGMLNAVKAGAREGVSGIRVSLDGRSVGELVAPYVSESIARDIVQ